MRFLLFIGFIACRGGDNKIQDSGNVLVDKDNDGYDASIDCDDEDPTIHPNSSENCDGVDNDCDGEIDNGVLNTFYADTDGDGFGNPEVSIDSCEAESGYVANGSDCNDENSEAYPGNVEVCDDVDNDCNGNVDDGLGDPFFIDADRDGFGNDEEIQLACSLQDGLSEIGGDCDDNDGNVNPLATEVCDGVDNNCDTSIDEGVTTSYYLDQDDDGYGEQASSVEACEQPSGYVTNPEDCNDANTGINPSAVEVCDFEDNNCDGNVDEDTAVDALLWFTDADTDGFGDANATTLACNQPSGFVSDNTDCDDTSSAVSPAASEVCGDNLDNDCDGLIDDGTSTDAVTWFADTDNDGFGDAASTTLACTQPVSHVLDSSDCDDNDDDVYPGAPEICNGSDDDCDVDIDEAATDALFWYADLDNDGFGDPNTSIDSCGQPSGHVLDNSDCNDQEILISPDAFEVCDGVDNNCDTVIDEDSAIDAQTWFSDSDNDTYGDPNASVVSCTQPSGYISDDTDCDDNDDDIYPGAPEFCDGVDSSCDGVLDNDDAVDAATWYADGDNDGFGDDAASMTSCSQPSGYLSDNTDCDDNDDDTFPGAAELCNGVDDNCDTNVDEDSALDALVWYADVDTDGFGDNINTILACNQPSGYLSDNTDCNDANGQINPNATETCDGADNNCNGDIDTDATVGLNTYYYDADQDGQGSPTVTTDACSVPAGHVTNATDCDDFDNDIYLGADEYCNGFDDNCDTVIDENTALDVSIWFSDADNDGYGGGNGTLSCNQPSNTVGNSDDCDDGNVFINPAADEVCDGSDNDCDGDVDANAINAQVWYLDGDNDGFGNPNVSTTACQQPSGYVGNNSDCNDGDANANLVSPEICDGIDNDCNGLIDDDASIVGTEPDCQATSCANILAQNPNAQDGVYYITGDNGQAVEAFCEMDFNGGGWLSVYNMMERPQNNTEAANMYASLSQNLDMDGSPVLPDSTTAGIHTSDIDLAQYSEVVYGWAPSSSANVSRYATYVKNTGLVGECYLDGLCSDGATIATMTVYPTGSVRQFQTGNQPTYPHVGIGWSGQIICWGYDLNNSSYGHWANWYDTKSCCTSGNTSEIQTPGWRYVIYVR